MNRRTLQTEADADGSPATPADRPMTAYTYDAAGNMAGEANGNGLTNVTDAAIAKSQINTAATITSVVDFNRNGQITTTDGTSQVGWVYAPTVLF